MTAVSDFPIASATVEVTADTLGFETAARVMAKHFTAMADELAALRETAAEASDR
jgi:hypothetical protein